MNAIKGVIIAILFSIPIWGVIIGLMFLISSDWFWDIFTNVIYR